MQFRSQSGEPIWSNSKIGRCRIERIMNWSKSIIKKESVLDMLHACYGKVHSIGANRNTRYTRWRVRSVSPARHMKRTWSRKKKKLCCLSVTWVHRDDGVINFVQISRLCLNWLACYRAQMLSSIAANC
jgi:hypothetical protein